MIINSKIKIGSRYIGKRRPVYIIAEIGSNHNQDLNTALIMIEEAAKTGCDAVKFQSIKFDEIYLEKRETAAFKKWFRQIELNEGWYKILANHSKKNGLDFISAPTYLRSIDLLEKINVKSYKLASPQVQGDPRIVERVSKLNKPIFLSMGYCNISEIKLIIKKFQKYNNKKFIPLHCISNYPAKPEDSNLNFIKNLEKISGQPVGFSDHSPGSHLAVAAVALGACVIEKHVTLNRKSKGPDHHFAMTFKEFKQMVFEIRDVEKSLKTNHEPIINKEIKDYRSNVELKIFTKNKIDKGSKIKYNDLMFYRTTNKCGIPYSKIDKVLNMKAKIDIVKETLINLSALKK